MSQETDQTLPVASLSSRRKRLQSLRWQVHCKREAAAEYRRKADACDARVAELVASIDQLEAELVAEDPTALGHVVDVSRGAVSR